MLRAKPRDSRQRSSIMRSTSSTAEGWCSRMGMVASQARNQVLEVDDGEAAHDWAGDEVDLGPR